MYTRSIITRAITKFSTLDNCMVTVERNIDGFHKYAKAEKLKPTTRVIVEWWGTYMKGRGGGVEDLCQ